MCITTKSFFFVYVFCGICIVKMVSRIQLRTWHMLGKHSTTEQHPQALKLFKFYFISALLHFEMWAKVLFLVLFFFQRSMYAWDIANTVQWPPLLSSMLMLSPSGKQLPLTRVEACQSRGLDPDYPSLSGSMMFPCHWWSEAKILWLLLHRTPPTHQPHLNIVLPVIHKQGHWWRKCVRKLNEQAKSMGISKFAVQVKCLLVP
jgi:hypothetical protein